MYEIRCLRDSLSREKREESESEGRGRRERSREIAFPERGRFQRKVVSREVVSRYIYIYISFERERGCFEKKSATNSLLVP